MISVRIYNKTAGTGVIQYVRLTPATKEKAKSLAKAAHLAGADYVECYSRDGWEVTFGDEAIHEEYIKQEGAKRSSLQIAEDRVRALGRRIKELEEKS